MKRIIVLALLCSASIVTAMDKKEAQLTFTRAQKGEDLTAYKAVLLQVYPAFATPETKDIITKTLDSRFAVILGWLGNERHRFVKIQDKEQPVGFLTLEALDQFETKIAIHHSPLLPAYLEKIKSFLEQQIKTEFPNAKMLYSSASGKAPKLQELVKSLGFEQDDTYKPSSELVPDSTGFVGYKKNL